MNKNIIKAFRTGALALAGLAAMYSCTDTWDEHYDAVSSIAYQGTTMQAIQDKASDFAEVLKAAGYDRELNSENVFTVWAPANGSFDKAALLEEIAQGDKQKVVKKFINSHVARYNKSLNNEPQEIMLMNNKQAEMGTVAEPTFGPATITEANISCKNGILHVVDTQNPYINNLYEQIVDLQEKSTVEHSLYKFLSVWNADSLDEAKSVYRDVNANGERVYVDSVMIRNNTVLNSVKALLYEEDSTYSVIIPTPEAYSARYELASSLLKFNPKEDDAKAGTCDSLQNYYANMFAMSNIYFNDNLNRSEQDSVVSTIYNKRNWEENVYYHPFAQGGIFAPDSYSQKVECSNGTAYLVDEYPMDVTKQFFRRIKLQLTENYVDRSEVAGKVAPQATDKAATMFPTYNRTYYPHQIKRSTVVTEAGTDSIVYDTIATAPVENITYISCSPSSSSAYPKYGFKIPNTLSGTYDIYLVTVPYWAKAGFVDSTPTETGYYFYATLFERQNGSEGANAKAGEYPSSGQRLTADAKHQSGNYVVSRNFDDDGTVLYTDTIHLGTHEFKNSYYNRNDEGVVLQFESRASTTQVNKQTYTREMLINSIILVPKTEEKDKGIIVIP